MCANQASRLWLCCAASRTPPPCGPRTTSGTVFRPPSMKRNFAAWLVIMSMVSAMKSRSVSLAHTLAATASWPT